MEQWLKQEGSLCLPHVKEYENGNPEPLWCLHVIGWEPAFSVRWLLQQASLHGARQLLKVQPSHPHSSQPKEEQKKNMTTSFKNTSWKLHTKVHYIPMAELTALVTIRGAGKRHLCSRKPCALLLLKKKGRMDIGKLMVAPLTASEKQTATSSRVQLCSNWVMFHYYCWTCNSAEPEG